MELHGFHHLTAISAHIRDNRRFYTQVLGMRLVKRSVNQDDVSAYHLFYADAVGHPGTDITFFDWDAPPERRGTRSIARTGLRVAGPEALAYWRERLAAEGVTHGELVERDGRLVLDFEDSEGQRLALVDDRGRGDAPTAWKGSPVPAVHQIRGLGPVLISLPDVRATDLVLTKVLGMEATRAYRHPDHAGEVRVYEMNVAGGRNPAGTGEMGPHAELHVAVEPDLPTAGQGAGGVHHVAFRTPNDEEYAAWLERLRAARIPNSGPVDRFWFRSLYFREPGGVLFEIATDGPGFGVDEDMAHLGETVVLPPFLEPRRAEILAGLKPLE